MFSNVAFWLEQLSLLAYSLSGLEQRLFGGELTRVTHKFCAQNGLMATSERPAARGVRTNLVGEDVDEGRDAKRLDCGT